MARVNMICIPFSGGNKFSYTALAQHAMGLVQVHTWEPPGRGARYAEPLQHSLELLADDLFGFVHDNVDEPYIIYGHSMGSLLARLLAHRLQQAGATMPLHLFLSGSRAISIRREPPHFHTMHGTDFVNGLRALGGSPEELLSDPDAMTLFEPVIRADFTAVEQYRYTDMPPLHVPMTVYMGSDDRPTYDEIMAWQKETAHPLQIKQYKGGHFFIFQHAKALMQSIIRQTYSLLHQPA